MAGQTLRPVSRNLVFSLIVSSGFALRVIPAAGGEPEPLVGSGQGSYGPSISRNANRLAYVRSTEDYNIWRIGISTAQARAEMDTIAGRLQQEYPRSNEARGVAVQPLREITNNVADRFVLILMSAALFVLVLACANVANVQLARGIGQQKEMAVRAAMGAGSFRIARQVMLQAILIALMGGALGLLFGKWNLDWTRTTFPPQVYKWMAGLKEMRINSAVVLFTAAASLVAGILCGMPAMFQVLGRTSASDLVESLKEGGRSQTAGPARSRLRSALVIIEVAAAMVLLVGAGLMVKTFQRMLMVNTGFNPKNVLSIQVALPRLHYGSDPQITVFCTRVLNGLNALPEVRAASTVSYLGAPEGMFIEGRPEPRPGEPMPTVRAVTDHYFEAMGTPVLEGRPITSQDDSESARVVVVSQSIARHYWPGLDPVGRRIKLGNMQSPWVTVVGVSADLKDWFTGRPQPKAYIPFLQAPRTSMNLIIRTAGDPMRMAKAAGAQVREVDRNQPVYDVKSMEQITFEQTSGVRVSANWMTLYAAIAMVLAVTGIYAVIAYSVEQRTHEIGVRVALGAGRAQIVKMVVWQALRIAGIGLAIGLPAAIVLTRVMSNALYDVVAMDPLTLAWLTIVLTAAALAAGYIPARRATKVDAVIALHHE